MCKRLTCLVALVVFLGLVLGGTAYGYEPLKDPALLGWWAFEDGSGSTCADSSANGRDGTVVDGDLVWEEGIHGGAIRLQGSLVEIPALNMSLTECTMAGWVNPNGNQPAWSAFLMTRGSATGLNINPDTGNLALGYHWGDASNTWSYRPGLSVADNEWSFVAVTITPTEAVFYLNAQETATNAVSHGSVNWNANVYIGGDGSGSFDARRVSDAAFDDVSLFSRALSAEEVARIMQGLQTPGYARNPVPADGATDVLRTIALSWEAGEFAASHDVYFGTVLDDVNDASVADPRGVLASPGQTGTTYDPPGRLELGQTYYWRVDEVNAPPDDMIYTGPVWSFTVEPETYPVANVTVTSSAPSDVGQGPELILNGSGLNEAGQHSNNQADMWVASPVADEPMVLQFDFDRVYKIQSANIWNFNHPYEIALRFGLKDITVEYAAEPNEWTVLGDVVLSQGTGRTDYAGQAIDFGGVAASSVRITATSNAGGQKYGLSEVRFYFVPTHAREPMPATDATNTAIEPVLTWRAGREAVSHEVYLSTDVNAVADGTALVDAVATNSYPVGPLDLATTYYWKVNEVNEAEPIPSWEGDVWGFTTQMFTLIEGFETYTDEEGSEVFQTWLDGFEVNGNGSVVGNINPPYNEGSIVASGDWSMPFSYENINGAVVAEAERTFVTPQNWTKGNPLTLAVSFYGTPDNTGRLYLKINGTKIYYQGDPADLEKSQWQQMLVDLSTLGNVTSVRTLTLGVEGAGASGMLYFDNIRLYPEPLELITPVQPDTAGLILRYSFDEGSGTVARDTSGSGNNGTLNGSPLWVAGAVGSGALEFDGVSDYVSTATSLLNDAEAFTIAYWLNADLSVAADRSGLVGQNDCIEHGVPSANTIQIWTPNGGSIDFDWPYGEQTEWHHIAMTGDGTSLAMYLDGKLVATGGSPLDEEDAGYGTSTSPVRIAGGGVMDATGNWLAGQFDEVHIYRRALSAAEVAGLFGRTDVLYKPL